MPAPHRIGVAAAALVLVATGYIAFRYWGAPGTVVLAIVVAVSGWALTRAVRP